MTWRSFLDYVLMCELGQDDAITRNYDLNNLNGSKPGIMLDRAFSRMGFNQYSTLRAHIVPTVAQRMRDVGYTPPEPVRLENLIREWYIWDRIRKEEIWQWPYKKSSANPLLD